MTSSWWTPSFRADPRGARIADRHYNRQAIGSPQFVPPGACYVLRHADDADGSAAHHTPSTSSTPGLEHGSTPRSATSQGDSAAHSSAKPSPTPAPSGPTCRRSGW